MSLHTKRLATPTDIIAAVTWHPAFPLDVQRIVGPHIGNANRNVRVVLARDVATWLCRRHTTMSFPELARIFHSRHSTRIESAQRAARLIATHATTPEGQSIADIVAELETHLQAIVWTTQTSQRAATFEVEVA